MYKLDLIISNEYSQVVKLLIVKSFFLLFLLNKMLLYYIDIYVHDRRCLIPWAGIIIISAKL